MPEQMEKGVAVAENNEHKTHAVTNYDTNTGAVWWKLPFDPTTSFSLLGYLMSVLQGSGNSEKKIDLTLNE